MKSFKKIILGVLACGMCVNMGVASVGATTSYYKGDVDGDGVVSSSDLVSMIGFLNGSKSSTGAAAERLDLDRNYIIDHCDKELLVDILLENTDTELVSSVNTTSLPAESDVRYNIYNPSTGGLKGNYTLHPNTSSVTRTASSNYGLIGAGDRRLPQDGLKGVLSVQTNGGAFLGTAFVVDSHTILTAAHVLYDIDNHSVNRNLQFKVYDPYDTATDIVITSKSYHIPNSFTSASGYNADYDYAIVTVNQDLSQYINFDLGIMRSGNMNSMVYVTGFGGNGKINDNVNSNFVHTKSTGYGSLTFNNPYNDYMINYQADTVSGFSGGPVYVLNLTNNTKTVIAINITETFTLLQDENGNLVLDENGNTIPDRNLYNSGLRINSNILHAVFNNSTNLSR